MTVILETCSLSFSYEEAEVLSDVSFQVEAESLVGLLGPNGSGKSTLLRLLDRTLRPAGGDVLLSGRKLPLYGNKELAQWVASVPQTFEIPFPFSCRELVSMGRFPHIGHFGFERLKDREMIQWAMEQTGVWGLRDRAITQISGGELQRVVISQALAQESRVLLLDEPTSHLDIAHQVEVMALLEDLKNEKHLTILLSLHDLNLASLYCDAIILLKGGRIHALGRPDTVVNAKNILEVYSAEVEASLDGTTGRPRVFLKKK